MEWNGMDEKASQYDDYQSYLGGFFDLGCHLGSNGIIGSTEEDYLIYDFTAKTGDKVNTLELFADPETEFSNNNHLGRDARLNPAYRLFFVFR